MSEVLIFKNDFGRCELDNELNWIFITFSGIVNVKQGNAVLEKALEVIKEKKCPGYVVDSSGVKGTYTMANDYIANEWMPQALANGCQFNAVIVSSDIFTQFATETLEKKVSGMTIKMFDKIEDVIAWIKSLSKK
ncbi:MAG: hypothetical protein GX587_05355 [Bacteroidales bacterium]|nr:hypothetical protein [Bacteroidales bacterium]